MSVSASSVSGSGTYQDAASILMLKKAMQMQQSNAQQLLQALPQPPSAAPAAQPVAAADPTATLGRSVDVFA